MEKIFEKPDIIIFLSNKYDKEAREAKAEYPKATVIVLTAVIPMDTVHFFRKTSLLTGLLRALIKDLLF